MNNLESQALEMMAGGDQTEAADKPDSNQKESEEAKIKRLAALSPIGYDRARIDEAKKLDCRPATLDALVKAARKDAGSEQPLVEQTEPYHLAINLADVLNEIRAAFNRHAILPPHADVAMTLWCAFTWFIEAVHFAPLLIIRAPESECGKTTVKDIVELFVRRPLSSRP